MMPPVRRSLVVLISALLAGVFAVAGASALANAAVKTYLRIVSITDIAEPQEGTAVEDRPFDIVASVPGAAPRPFNVVVEVRDAAQDSDPEPEGQLVTVTKATAIVLEQVSGPGVLGGTTTAVIPRNGSGATISGATYSKVANDVVLQVRATSGVQLNPAQVTVDVALTAVSGNADRGQAFELDDPQCGAGGGVPTSGEPTCGHLLTKGADGHVIMSVGSCDGLANCSSAGNTTALVVTVNADIVPTVQDPYSTLILGCDKVLCGGSGVPRIPVLYTFDNSADLTQTIPDCPAKGVLGANQEICADYVQSTRSAGDLYIYVLFAHDLRCGF